MIMSELSIHELETQQGELLPEREALGGFFYNAGVIAHVNQYVEANQALTLLSKNTAVGVVTIIN